MDKDVYLRRTVADNPSTPAETLKVLANDEDVSVRQSVKLRRD